MIDIFPFYLHIDNGNVNLEVDHRVSLIYCDIISIETRDAIELEFLKLNTDLSYSVLDYTLIHELNARIYSIVQYMKSKYPDFCRFTEMRNEIL